MCYGIYELGSAAGGQAMQCVSFDNNLQAGCRLFVPLCILAHAQLLKDAFLNCLPAACCVCSMGAAAELSFSTPVETAFRHAAAAGVFVSAACGNTGPGPYTIVDTWCAACYAFMQRLQQDCCASEQCTTGVHNVHQLSSRKLRHGQLVLLRSAGG